MCSMKVQPCALLLGVVRNAAESFLKESKGQPIDLTSKNKPKREERERENDDLETILRFNG